MLRGPLDSLCLRGQLVLGVMCFACSSAAFSHYTLCPGVAARLGFRSLRTGVTSRCSCRVFCFCFSDKLSDLFLLPLPQTIPILACQNTELGVSKILGMESGSWTSPVTQLSAVQFWASVSLAVNCGTSC